MRNFHLHLTGNLSQSGDVWLAFGCEANAKNSIGFGFCQISRKEMRISEK